MSEDGFAELAARAEKVRTERRLMREGLTSLEGKLVEYVGELGAGNSSDFVLLESYESEYGAAEYVIKGYLYFDGATLSIVAMKSYADGYQPDEEFLKIDEVPADWQRKLSDPQVVQSLMKNTLANLDDEYTSTAQANKSLSQFVTIEKAEIDSDLDDLFSSNKTLLESWMKARKAVQTDPELSITLSCSHVETVLKGCLKSLNATDYETLPIEKLARKTLGLLKADNAIDSVTAEMVQGAITMSKSIGETRNFKSSSHGKSEGYVPPTTDLAQLANHLAGVVSVFVMKQTERVMKAK